MPEYSPAELVQKWEEFFDAFDYAGPILSVADAYPETRTLEIQFAELNRFDTDFAIYFLRYPQTSLVAGEEAITRKAPAGEETIRVHLRVKNLPRDLRIMVRDLRSEHLGQFVTVEGLVRKATEVRPKIVDATFQCLRCQKVIKEPQEGQAFREPMECYPDQEGCGRTAASTKFKLIGEASQYLDTQKIEIQEPPEILRGGQEPQRIEGYLEDDITGQITPGERIVLSGVLRSAQRGRPGAKSTIFDIFVEINSVEKERVEFEELDITPEDVRLIRDEAQRPNIIGRIVQSISPTLYGLEMEKEALALQLFGGVAKRMPDGTRIRGDIHALLIGDPGSGKSQLLQYMSTIAPRAMFVSGKGTSAAGLLAAAVKDDFGEGRWTLEAGALVLADRGLACIDEIEKMNPQDRGSIHVAMEEQMVHIAKAGITATLPSRCAVLAAANPKFGRFVPEKYIGEQFNLEPALLSVSADTPILVRQRGIVRSTVMSELVDPYYEGKAEALPVDVTGLEVPCMRQDTLKIEWRPVRYVFRHPFANNLLKLHLETGRTVTVTPGHSIYGLRGGRVVSIPSDQFHVGDYVAIPKKIPAVSSATSEFLLARELLRLPAELRENIYLHEVPVAAFGRLPDLPKHLARGRKLPLARAGELTDEELRACQLRVRGGSGDPVPPVLPVDGRLMRFLGYFVAEGSALVSSSRSHIISFALGPKDDAIVEDLRNICKELFGARTSEFHKGTSRKVNLLNKVAYLFLVHVLRVALGSHQKAVPDLVFNVDPSLQMEFVQAYWDGDAGVTVSSHLISDLLYLFLNRRTVASAHFDGKTRTAMLRGRPITSHGSFQLVSPRPPRWVNRGYHAHLPKRHMTEMFMSLSDLDLARDFWGVPAKGGGRDGISPHWWTEFRGPRMFGRLARFEGFSTPKTQAGYEALWNLGPGSGQAFVQKWWRRGMLGRRDCHDGTTAYEYFLSDIGRATLGDVRFVERFQRGDVALVRIKAIEECPPTPFVYDLSVPGDENFVAGLGGVICHNSRFDVIFPVQDIPQAERDRRMADHILHAHRLGEIRRTIEELGETPATEEPAAAYTPYFAPDFLRKYVAYAKRIYPVMTPDAMDRIRDHYLDIRKQGEAPGASVPITPRQLEAYVRLSEASARARLSPLVDAEDAERAVGIIEYWLRRVATEGGTGPLDIDIVTTGVPASQREQIVLLRDVIAELGGTETGEGANQEDILELAERRGIPRDRAEAWLRKWRQEGELYSPIEGRYKLVTRL